MNTDKKMVDFVCAARSRNRVPAGDPNGKRGCIVIARDGTMFEIKRPCTLAPKVGEVLRVQKRLHEYLWWNLGFQKDEAKQLDNAGTENARLAWELHDKKAANLLARQEPNRILRPSYKSDKNIIQG